MKSHKIRHTKQHYIRLRCLKTGDPYTKHLVEPCTQKLDITMFHVNAKYYITHPGWQKYPTTACQKLISRVLTDDP